MTSESRFRMGGQAQVIALDGEIVVPDDRGAHITTVSGVVRRLTNCASRIKNGKPPKWSPCKCVMKMVPMAFGSTPKRRMAIIDEAPQSTRNWVNPLVT